MEGEVLRDELLARVLFPKVVVNSENLAISASFLFQELDHGLCVILLIGKVSQSKVGALKG